MITSQQFSRMISTNREPDEWFSVAVKMFEKYDINTTNRIAGFMAQTAHETGDYNTLKENLNYSTEALLRVFGKRYFRNAAHADQYARNPKKIANYVYMDKNRSKRGALGNVIEGDGYKFLGRGVKQLTGRSNYAAFGKSIGMSADDVADYIITKEGALESACWFWKKNKLAKYADRNDIDGMSKRVNGGDIGMSARRNRYSLYKNIMGGGSSIDSDSNYRTLKRGSRGQDVLRMQEALGITADGIFGFGTAAALKKWQRQKGLLVDGIAGNNTLTELFS